MSASYRHILHMQQYLKLRCNDIFAMKRMGQDPYPHKFPLTTSLPEFIERYQHLGNGEQHGDVISVDGKKDLNSAESNIDSALSL